MTFRSVCKHTTKQEGELICLTRNHFYTLKQQSQGCLQKGTSEFVARRHYLCYTWISNATVGHVLMNRWQFANMNVIEECNENWNWNEVQYQCCELRAIRDCFCCAVSQRSETLHNQCLNVNENSRNSINEKRAHLVWLHRYYFEVRAFAAYWNETNICQQFRVTARDTVMLEWMVNNHLQGKHEFSSYNKSSFKWHIKVRQTNHSVSSWVHAEEIATSVWSVILCKLYVCVHASSTHGHSNELTLSLSHTPTLPHIIHTITHTHTTTTHTPQLPSTITVLTQHTHTATITHTTLLIYSLSVLPKCRVRLRSATHGSHTYTHLYTIPTNINPHLHCIGIDHDLCCFLSVLSFSLFLCLSCTHTNTTQTIYLLRDKCRKFVRLLSLVPSLSSNCEVPINLSSTNALPCSSKARISEPPCKGGEIHWTLRPRPTRQGHAVEQVAHLFEKEFVLQRQMPHDLGQQFNGQLLYWIWGIHSNQSINQETANWWVMKQY